MKNYIIVQKINQQSFFFFFFDAMLLRSKEQIGADITLKCDSAQLLCKAIVSFSLNCF